MKTSCSFSALVVALACALGARIVDGVTIASMSRAASRSIVRMEFSYTLRICNIYPGQSPLNAFMHHGVEKINAEALAYKTCADFKPPIKAGDTVDFKIGEADAGTFTIQELPSNDAVLLLVVSRHDVHSSAVAFESHVFANVPETQVAVIDLYKGGNKSDLWVQDVVQGAAPAAGAKPILVAKANATTHRDMMRFNSVVAVAPGVYDLMLSRQQGQATVRSAEFVAQPGEAYVVIRCGIEAEAKEKGGLVDLEDLVVFPQSGKPVRVHGRGGAGLQRISPLLAVLLALVVVVSGGAL